MVVLLMLHLHRAIHCSELFGDAFYASFGDAWGFVRYVAPEILNRQPYGVKIDVWSIGVIA